MNLTARITAKKIWEKRVKQSAVNISRMPKELLENDSFIKEILCEKIIALQYLPEYASNKAFILALAEKSKDPSILKYLPEKLLNNNKFMQQLTVALQTKTETEEESATVAEAPVEDEDKTTESFLKFF